MKHRFLILVFPMMILVGCAKLTKEQEADLAAANKDFNEARTEASLAAEELAALAPLVKEALDAVKEGKVGEAGKKAVAAYKAYKAREDELKKRWDAALEKGKSAKDRAEKVRASGVGWLQIAGSFVWKNLPLIIGGVSAALGGAKYVKVRRALGVTSRALTVLSDSESDVKTAGEAVSLELVGSKLSDSDMRIFKSLAKAGKI